jgi:hypothetical protein
VKNLKGICGLKKLTHSKLPITLECSDVLDINMLQAIDIQMTAYGWDMWIDEYGDWFVPFYKNPNQLELFDEE